jgi:MoxR-like ATPase
LTVRFSFLLYIKIGYPSAEEEVAILTSTTGSKKEEVNAVIGAEEIKYLQGLTRQVSISEDLVQYVSDLIRATRPDTTLVSYVKEWVRWGAGPRAGQALILTAKARALMYGRYAVLLEDLQTMAYPVLRHRILMNFKADSEEVTTDHVTSELLKSVLRTKVSN